MDSDSVMRVLYLAILLAALAGWALVEFRKDFSRTLKMALAWGLIFLGVLAAYGLWGDISRGVKPQQMVDSGTVTLPRAADGHYYADLTINGVGVTFMADTGASDVVLTPRDARKVGIDPDNLAYTGAASTANGIVKTARVRLDAVTLGPFEDADLRASINKAPMEVSLLGMDYLGRFQISIAGDQMVLRR